MLESQGEKSGGSLAIHEGHGVCYADVMPTRAEYNAALANHFHNTTADRVLSAAHASVGHELWLDTGVPAQLSAAVSVSRVLEQAGEISKINPTVQGLAAELTSPERKAQGRDWEVHSFNERQAGDLILTDHRIGIVGKDGHNVFTNVSDAGIWGESNTSEKRYAADPKTYVLRPHEKSS